MITRYGQLSYASLDGAGPRGGWQVKETTGALTSGETELLVSGLRTALHPIEHLPAYPTADQLNATPRRLVYRRVEADTAGYWHTAVAGCDSTGRPGNAFTHAVLDRDAAQTKSSPRPIELWRSPGWLTPYGTSAVSAAVLPDDAPERGSAVNVESVVQFVCDTDTWRLGTLCGLLDAVAAALNGGPAVALGVESPDNAALWIGAVSFLMSPGTARQLNFSTFERSSDPEHLLEPSLHVLAVPRTDLHVAPPGLTMIDESDVLSLGQLPGNQHRTATGQQIEATAWSAMAQVAFAHPAYAAELLTDIDEFAAEVVDVGLPPALPMAISVLNRSWGDDAVPEAEAVVTARSLTAQLNWSR